VSRVVVVEARRQFGSPKEGDRMPLDAVTRGLVKRQQAVIVNFKV
jgi:hypothetical protein